MSTRPARRRKRAPPAADASAGVGYGRRVQVRGRIARGESSVVPAAIVATIVGALGVLAAGDAGGRLEVAALTSVTVAGFCARAAWPGMPPVVLALWTFSPAVALSLQERGEGTMFLLVVAVCFFVLETANPRTRIVAGLAGVLAPAAIQV